MFRRVGTMLLSGATMLFLSATYVNAFMPVPKALSVPSSTPMPTGTRTMPPFAHVIFCQQHPSECRASGAASRAVLTAEKWQELTRINASVNGSIRARNDSGALPDEWSVSPAAGDCEDYALTKRSLLVRRGWPSRALSVAVVDAPGRGAHAVLVARTDHGDYVLDNLSRNVRPWRSVSYRWAKVQASDNPHNWVTF